MQNQARFGSFSVNPPKKPAPKRPSPFPTANTSQKKQKTTNNNNDDSDSSAEGDGGNAEEIITPEEKVRKESIIQQMTHSQVQRHEAFAQSTFYKTQKKTIKAEMASVSGNRISQNSVVVMCGITKVFVGELTEAAKTVMQEWNHTGPIKPVHLREAYNRLNKEGLVVKPKTAQKKIFRR
jgi:transcription initiation factor TFIID subunit 11